MKDVQADDEVDEDELEEMVRLPPTLFLTNPIIILLAHQSKGTTRKRISRKSKREQSYQIQSKARLQYCSVPLN